MSRCRLSFIALCVAVASFAGCGPTETPRYQFAGKITYQGQPIPAGIMYFDPDHTPPGNDGPQGHAMISNGEFDTRKPGGQGPGGGRYRVRIYAHDGIPAPELPMGNLLFPETTLPVDLPMSDGPLDLNVP